MFGLTVVLLLCVFLLGLLQYLRVLYDTKRNVEILEEKIDEAGIKQNMVRKYPQAPGPPYVWPIFGNMVDLGKHSLPTIAFNELSKRYGDIFSMTLGSTRCVVVSSLKLMLTLLNKYGNSIDARPNFIRFHQLFDGNRDHCKCDIRILFFCSCFFTQFRETLAVIHCRA